MPRDPSHREIKSCIAQVLGSLDDSVPPIVGYSFLCSSDSGRQRRSTLDWMVILEYSSRDATSSLPPEPVLQHVRQAIVGALAQAGYTVGPEAVVLIPKQ